MAKTNKKMESVEQTENNVIEEKKMKKESRITRSEQLLALIEKGTDNMDQFVADACKVFAFKVDAKKAVAEFIADGLIAAQDIEMFKPFYQALVTTSTVREKGIKKAAASLEYLLESLGEEYVQANVETAHGVLSLIYKHGKKSAKFAKAIFGNNETEIGPELLAVALVAPEVIQSNEAQLLKNAIAKIREELNPTEPK